MKRVLLVDDDRLVRTIITDLLSDNGYFVVAELNAEAAVERVRSELFDVLITDLRLPGANGLQLLDVCRGVAPQMGTVAMSAYASAADYKLALRLGVVELLVKPFTPEEMLQAVRRALHRGRGFRASFDGLSLPDILQMCHQLQRTGTVRVEGVGVAHFVQGELYHVTAPGQDGMPALVTLLTAQDGHLSIGPPEPLPRQSLRLAFPNLMLEALSILDARRAGRPVVERDPSLDIEAIEAAFTPVDERSEAQTAPLPTLNRPRVVRLAPETVDVQPPDWTKDR